MIGAIASSTTLHTALFLIPVLTGMVAVATATAKGMRRWRYPMARCRASNHDGGRTLRAPVAICCVSLG